MSHRHLVQAPKDIASNSMLASLVMGNADVVGLLGYSLYCQCKEEWRAAFNQTFGREPDAHETTVYELGEQTARRKITYRFLADARLAGAYTNIGRSAARHSFIQKIYEHHAKAAILRRPVLLGMPVPGGKVFAILLAFALGTALPFTMRLLH